MFNRNKRLFSCSVFLVLKVFILSILLNSVLQAKSAYAQEILPSPTKLISISKPAEDFVLTGLKFDQNNPHNIEFLFDAGAKFPSESDKERNLQYFLAAMALPLEDLWINLSPYEQDRIQADSLNGTDLGNGLLEQDYILKLLSSSLTYPKSSLGSKYWDEVNEVEDKSLTQAYNKVWIIPGEISIAESSNGIYISNSELDIETANDRFASSGDGANRDVSDVFSKYIVPEIKKDVNSGENFSTLRQIYRAVILAQWFKTKVTDPVWKHYIVSGIKDNLKNESIKNEVYSKYKRSVEKGVYKDVNNIKGSNNKQVYCVGGVSLKNIFKNVRNVAIEKVSNITQGVLGFSVEKNDTQISEDLKKSNLSESRFGLKKLISPAALLMALPSALHASQLSDAGFAVGAMTILAMICIAIPVGIYGFFFTAHILRQVFSGIKLLFKVNPDSLNDYKNLYIDYIEPEEFFDFIQDKIFYPFFSAIAYRRLSYKHLKEFDKLPNEARDYILKNANIFQNSLNKANMYSQVAIKIEDSIIDGVINGESIKGYKRSRAFFELYFKKNESGTKSKIVKGLINQKFETDELLDMLEGKRIFPSMWNDFDLEAGLFISELIIKDYVGEYKYSKTFDHNYMVKLVTHLASDPFVSDDAKGLLEKYDVVKVLTEKVIAQIETDYYDSKPCQLDETVVELFKIYHKNLPAFEGKGTYLSTLIVQGKLSMPDLNSFINGEETGVDWFKNLSVEERRSVFLSYLDYYKNSNKEMTDFFVPNGRAYEFLMQIMQVTDGDPSQLLGENVGHDVEGAAVLLGKGNLKDYYEKIKNIDHGGSGAKYILESIKGKLDIYDSINIYGLDCAMSISYYLRHNYEPDGSGTNQELINGNNVADIRTALQSKEFYSKSQEERDAIAQAVFWASEGGRFFMSSYPIRYYEFDHLVRETVARPDLGFSKEIYSDLYKIPGSGMSKHFFNRVMRRYGIDEDQFLGKKTDPLTEEEEEFEIKPLDVFDSRDMFRKNLKPFVKTFANKLNFFEYMTECVSRLHFPMELYPTLVDGLNEIDELLAKLDKEEFNFNPFAAPIDPYELSENSKIKLKLRKMLYKKIVDAISENKHLGDDVRYLMGLITENILPKLNTKKDLPGYKEEVEMTLGLIDKLADHVNKHKQLFINIEPGSEKLQDGILEIYSNLTSSDDYLTNPVKYEQFKDILRLMVKSEELLYIRKPKEDEIFPPDHFQDILLKGLAMPLDTDFRVELLQLIKEKIAIDRSDSRKVRETIGCKAPFLDDFQSDFKTKYGVDIQSLDPEFLLQDMTDKVEFTNEEIYLLMLGLRDKDPQIAAKRLDVLQRVLKDETKSSFFLEQSRLFYDFFNGGNVEILKRTVNLLADKFIDYTKNANLTIKREEVREQYNSEFGFLFIDELLPKQARFFSALTRKYNSEELALDSEGLTLAFVKTMARVDPYIFIDVLLERFKSGDYWIKRSVADAIFGDELAKETLHKENVALYKEVYSWSMTDAAYVFNLDALIEMVNSYPFIDVANGSEANDLEKGLMRDVEEFFKHLVSNLVSDDSQSFKNLYKFFAATDTSYRSLFIEILGKSISDNLFEKDDEFVAYCHKNIDKFYSVFENIEEIAPSDRRYEKVTSKSVLKIFLKSLYKKNFGKKLDSAVDLYLDYEDFNAGKVTLATFTDKLLKAKKEDLKFIPKKYRQMNETFNKEILEEDKELVLKQLKEKANFLYTTNDVFRFDELTPAVASIKPQDMMEDYIFCFDFINVVHSNLPYILTAYEVLNKMAAQSGKRADVRGFMLRLRKYVSSNNSLTRILRMLSEEFKTYGYVEAVKPIMESGSFDVFSELLLSLSEYKGVNVPSSFSGILEIIKENNIITTTQLLNLRKQIKGYFETGVDTLIPQIFKIYTDIGQGNEFETFVEEAKGELTNVAFGGYKGLSQQFMDKWGLDDAAEADLFTKILPIKNLTAKDYSKVTAKIKKSINKGYQKKMPNSFRKRYVVSLDTVDKEKQEGFDQALDELKLFLNDLSVEDNNEFVFHFLYQQLIDISGSGFSLELLESTEGVDIIGATRMYKSLYSNLLEIRTRLSKDLDYKIDQLTDTEYKDLVEKYNKLHFIKISNRTRFPSGQKEVSKTLNNEKLNYDEKVSKIANMIEKQWLANITASEKTQEELDKWYEESIKLFLSKIKNTQFSDDELRTFVKQAYQQAVDSLLSKEIVSDEEKVRGFLSDAIIKEFEKEFVKALPLTKKIFNFIDEKVKGAENVVVGLYDDYPHLNEFRSTGVCTWESRPKQMDVFPDHFAVIAVQDPLTGRFLGTSQVQLLKTGVMGVKSSRGKYKTLSLTGINLTIDGLSSYSSEQLFDIIIDAAKRIADDHKMPLVIVEERVFRSNTPFENDRIESFVGKKFTPKKLWSIIPFSLPPSPTVVSNYNKVLLVEDKISNLLDGVVEVVGNDIYEVINREFAVDAVIDDDLDVINEKYRYFDVTLPKLMFSTNNKDMLYSELDNIFNSFPEKLVKDVKRQVMEDGAKFELVVNPDQQESKLNISADKYEFAIGQDIVMGGIIDTVLLKDRLTDLLVSFVLRNESKGDERYALKHSMLKSFMNYDTKSNMLHRASMGNDWSFVGDYHNKEESVRLNEEDEFIKNKFSKFVEESYKVSQWNLFLSIFEDNNSQVLVDNYWYYHKYIVEGEQDDIAERLNDIIDFSDNMVSLSRLRNVFKDFILDGKARIKQEYVDNPHTKIKQTFDNFDDTEKLLELKKKLLTLEGNELMDSYRELMEYIFESEHIVQDECTRLFDSLDNELKIEDGFFLEYMLQEVLVRRFGKSSFDFIKQFMSAQHDGSNIPYLSVLDADLNSGDNADEYRDVLMYDYTESVYREIGGEEYSGTVADPIEKLFYRAPIESEMETEDQELDFILDSGDDMNIEDIVVDLDHASNVQSLEDASDADISSIVDDLLSSLDDPFDPLGPDSPDTPASSAIEHKGGIDFSTMSITSRQETLANTLKEGLIKYGTSFHSLINSDFVLRSRGTTTVGSFLAQ